MKPPAAEISVRAHESKGLVLEQYAYTPGTVEPIPKHSHEEYQFALSFDHVGEYFYRGEKHQIPPARLSIIHAGEVHAPSDRTSLDEPAHFAMANIHPNWLRKVLSEMAASARAKTESYDPFFETVLQRDDQLNRLFLNLSAISQSGNSQLAQDIALLDFLSHLIQQHALHQLPESSFSPRRAVLRACEYLQAHYEKDVSLEKLAAIAGLSRFHFCRVFRKEIGVSASTYQLQLRLSQAKKLIIQGRSLSEVAIATGFYDQSHLGKHFKRYIGTTPSRYLTQTTVSP